MLLFSERTWKHHCVTLVLPFAVLSYGLAPGFPSRVRRTALAVVAIAGLSMLSTSSGVLGDEPNAKETFAAMEVATGPTAFIPGFDAAARSDETARLGLAPDSPGKIAQVYGAYVWAFLALMVGLGVT